MKKIILIFATVFILTAILLNIGPLYAWASYYLKGVEAKSPQAAQMAKDESPTTDSRKLETALDEAVLTIPSLNISAPIVFSQSKKEADLQKDLENGVALYPGSVLPGESGTSVIIGHSSSYPWYKGDYGNIFSLLEKLKAGDKIIIIYKEKNITYLVKNQIKSAPQSVQLLQTQGSDLILMSCWPMGINSIRIAVSANLNR